MRMTVLLSLSLGAALALQPLKADAKTDAFIQFTNSAGTAFKGESTVVGHVDWSKVDSWSWLVSAEASFSKGVGLAVGKAQPGPFRWQQNVDRTYAELFKLLVQGRESDKVRLDVTTSVGSSQPVVFFSMEFGDAFYSKLATSSGADGLLKLNGELVFREVSLSYKPIDATGRLGTAVTARWNIVANTLGSQAAYEFSGDPMALEGLTQAMALAVPEPQTWLMLIGGLAGLGLHARRRAAAQRG